MYTHSHIHYIYVTLLKMILYLKTRFREDRLRLQFGRTMYPDIEWLLQYSCLFDQCLLMKRGFLCNHRICWCGGCYMVTALFISFDDLARYIRILCAISQFFFITINFSWCFSDSPWIGNVGSIPAVGMCGKLFNNIHKGNSKFRLKRYAHLKIELLVLLRRTDGYRTVQKSE